MAQLCPKSLGKARATQLLVRMVEGEGWAQTGDVPFCGEKH